MLSNDTTLPPEPGRTESTESRYRRLVTWAQRGMGKCLSTRPLTWNDIPTIVELAAKVHAESTLKDLKFSASHTEYELKKVMHHPGERMCHLLVWSSKDIPEEQIVGLITGFVTLPFTSTDIVAFDHTFFVLEGHRGFHQIVALISTYVSWALNVGAKQINIGAMPEPYDERVFQLFDRLGFALIGKLYRVGV